MAGFLRKKSKQDPQPKPSSSQLPPSSPTVPPLFARFATSQPASETQRVVSSPMLLSSGRKEVQLASQHRGSRGVSTASVQARRDAELRAQRNQPYATVKAREPPSDQERNSQLPHLSSAQPRARPISRVPAFDKPLPSPFGSETLNASRHEPVTAPAGPRPVSQNLSPIEGEYAHLWSVIANDDKAFFQPAEPTSADPPHTPRETPDRTVKPDTLRPNRTSIITPSQSLPIPLSSTDALSLSETQETSFSLSSNHAIVSDDPGSDFHSQTSIPRPSNRPSPRQELLYTMNGSRSDLGASASQTTLSSSYDGLSNGVLGNHWVQPPISSHNERPSSDQIHNVFNATTPGFSLTENSNPTPLPNSSSPPKASRKLTKVKTRATPSAKADSRFSVLLEDDVSSSQPLRSKPGDSQQSHTDNMGISASSLEAHVASPLFKSIRPQDMPVESHNSRTAAPRETTAYASTSPLRKSPSMGPMNIPSVVGKPLIFAAMAAVNHSNPSLTAAPPTNQGNTRSDLPPTPTPQQGYPSPPAEFSFPPRKDSLSIRATNQTNSTSPQVAVTHSANNSIQGTRPPSSYSPGPSHTPSASKDIKQRHTGSPRTRPHTADQAISPPKTSKRNESASGFSIHSHSSSINGAHQRTPIKMRSTTPIAPGRVGPIQIDGDRLGVPLDEDPFAKVEGVKMLMPISRSASPVKDATITRHKPNDSRKDILSEYHSASEGSSQSGSPKPTNKASGVNALPSPITPEKLIPEQYNESETVPPPVVAGEAGSQDRFTGYLSDPHLLKVLLGFLSFYDWCMILSLSREIRYTLVQNQLLRETVLERFLETVGYTRWAWKEPDPLSLSLQDLNDYMRGVSTPTHEYARVAALYIHSLSIHPAHRDQSLYETVHQLAASTRAYSRVVLRLRAQAEKEASMVRTRGIGASTRGTSRPPSRAPSPTISSVSHANHSYVPAQPQQSTPKTPAPSGFFQSPLFRLRRAPLLRVFVPSPDGDWLSDKSVLECEAECRRGGIANMLRVGDVVWDVAVGDEGNVGRLVWDGSYLIDLDYTYSPIGDLPKYMPTLAFPPSYFHRVIRTGPSSSNPIVHIDIRPWGEEIAANLQLLQDRVRTETPQGAYHNVVRWVHRSSFVVRPPGGMRSPSQHNNQRNTPQFPPRIPIPDSNNLFVDPGWYGTIVVETEGTNESLADLQDRCGPGVFPPRPRGVSGYNGSPMDRENKTVFRVLREKSRPGEIWIRAVSAKERLL